MWDDDLLSASGAIIWHGFFGGILLPWPPLCYHSIVLAPPCWVQAGLCVPVFDISHPALIYCPLCLGCCVSAAHCLLFHPSPVISPVAVNFLSIPNMGPKYLLSYRVPSFFSFFHILIIGLGIFSSFFPSCSPSTLHGLSWCLYTFLLTPGIPAIFLFCVYPVSGLIGCHPRWHTYNHSSSLFFAPFT